MRSTCGLSEHRQHRNDAAREVDARGSVIGVHINRRACFDVVAHVSNGHEQTPSFGTANLGGFAINRIIKVPRIFTIYSDQRDVCEIDAIFFILGTHFVWQATCLSQTSV